MILTPGSGKITINKKPLEQFFPLETLRQDVVKPLEVTQSAGKYDVRVNVEGGGTTGQAGAIRLSIARALVSLERGESSPAPRRRVHDARSAHGGTEEIRSEESAQEIPVLEALTVVRPLP